MADYRLKAKNFLENEKEFQLGFLSSEASNPITASLDKDFAESITRGVETLFRVDMALLPVFRDALNDKRFREVSEAMSRALKNGKRIVFSGCGATGRLSILLEAMWRDYRAGDELSESVGSIMTGGDFALVKSVEFFEDYPEFGRRQAEDAKIAEGDVLIGITATGETASVIGTVMAAAEQGAAVFMLICVQKDIPMNRLERCRRAYGHPNVTVVDMPCGGMAIAGSTRMQSTTLEMLVAAAALEKAAEKEPSDYAEAYERMIASLIKPENVQAIAEYIDFETGIYQNNGLIDYYADKYLLDILTDTTERSPTFTLPPFRRSDDQESAPSWAFVKNPQYSTNESWLHCFRRQPRCLGWTEEDYKAMGTSDLIAKGLPRITLSDLLKIEIGNEPAEERADAKTVEIVVDSGEISFKYGSKSSDIKVDIAETALNIFEHLAVKLVMNIISTGTMVKMGRVSGNYMTYLDVSNKKLIDRGTRIIADQCGLKYEEACLELFKSMEELEEISAGGKKESPVRYTITKLDRNVESKDMDFINK